MSNNEQGMSAYVMAVVIIHNHAVNKRISHL